MVLIVAAVGLFDSAALLRIWRVSGAECGLALFTMVGVIWLDMLHGILLAVELALVLLIRRASRPQDFELRHVPGMRGWHEVALHPDAPTHPGLIVYRFGSAIVFFDAGYFKKRAPGAARPHRMGAPHRSGWA